MVIAGTAIVSMLVFLLALLKLRVAGVAAQVMATAHDGVKTLRDRRLDDNARETAMRRASLRCLAALASIMVRVTAAVAVSAVPVWLAGVSGIVTAGQVVRFLGRWDVEVIATAVMAPAYAIWVRRWRTS